MKKPLRLKTVLKCFLLLLFILIAVFVFQNYPVSSPPKNFPALSDTSNIRRNLASIINTPLPRNYRNVAVLDTVAARIELELRKHTGRVSIQAYTAEGNQYKNVIASFGPENAERIIVGAHYDVCGQQDGADDNASGVAGILELARLLKDQQLRYRIDLVAYTLEEPPYFRTDKMGSYIHARSLHDAKVPVLGMVSLEMIGYFSDEENSQRYPVGVLKWIYGSKGNFITIVQKSICGKFARQFKKLLFSNNSILTKSFRSPSFMGGTDLSDHRNYWAFDYSAVMITNTAFFRNNNYHQPSDKLPTLNVQKMALVIDGVYRSLIAYEK